MSRTRRLLSAAFTILIAVSVLGASGDGARFNDIGHRMMCVCGCNQVLLECNHVGCPYSDSMRNKLMAAIQRDNSDDGVLQAFVQEFGTTVLAAPTARGFDKVAWITPFAVFFAGTFTAAALIRNWRRHQPAGLSSHPSSPALDNYREQVRKETEL